MIGSIGNGQVHEAECIGEVARTLNCMHDQQAVITEIGGGELMESYQKATGTLMANSHPGSYCGQDAYSDMLVAGVDCRNGTESEVNGTLQAKSGGGYSLNTNQVVRTRHIVRRLAPLECERLQGFPDNWTLIGEPEKKEVIDYEYTYDDEGNEVDKVEVGRHTEIEYYYTDSQGKRRKCSDSARYKALGNSIALPPWKWVLKRISACYERDATMASLFDGIGGFPLIWEQINGKGSCLWTSEIEEFPMAVTRHHWEE